MGRLKNATVFPAFSGAILLQESQGKIYLARCNLSGKVEEEHTVTQNASTFVCGTSGEKAKLISYGEVVFDSCLIP